MSEYEELVRRLRHYASGAPGKRASTEGEAARAIAALEAELLKWQACAQGLAKRVAQAETRAETAEAELAKWRERWEAGCSVVITRGAIRCLVTGNPYGTDAHMVGALPDCLVCEAMEQNEGKRVRILVEE